MPLIASFLSQYPNIFSPSSSFSLFISSTLHLFPADPFPYFSISTFWILPIFFQDSFVKVKFRVCKNNVTLHTKHLIDLFLNSLLIGSEKLISLWTALFAILFPDLSLFHTSYPKWYPIVAGIWIWRAIVTNYVSRYYECAAFCAGMPSVVSIYNQVLWFPFIDDHKRGWNFLFLGKALAFVKASKTIL